jgi:hypothetical protein
MDYRKINSHIILSLTVLIVSVTISMIGRRVMLEKGFDTGTANLTFLIILGVCVILYFIILATLAHIIVPWLMKKLPNNEKPTPTITQESTHESNAFDEKEEMFEQSNEDIRQNADKLYLEKQTAKINLFLVYSHLTMAPFLTDDELLYLDEYIRCYAGEEPLPNNLTPIKPKKLINLDMGHFGWNMANYFGYKKEDVADWLQKVFFSLRNYSLSSIIGKLRDSTKKEYNIPIINDIPEFLREQKS